MLVYSPEFINRAKEFWYVFDEYTQYNADFIQICLECNLFKIDPRTNEPRPNLDWMFFSLKEKMRAVALNYEQLFLEEVSGYTSGIKKLFQNQTRKISEHLNDFNEIQQALELFGQGVLYDNRTGRVHKMDGLVPQHLVGYRRWHGFLRAAVSVGEDKDFCLNLDRCILLAYLIQSELRPLDTKRDNPYMSNERLSEYASSCMPLEFKALDEAFNYYFP
jgi:hypothetical protein